MIVLCFLNVDEFVDRFLLKFTFTSGLLKNNLLPGAVFSLISLKFGIGIGFFAAVTNSIFTLLLSILKFFD